jgi:signal peptidase I
VKHTSPAAALKHAKKQKFYETWTFLILVCVVVPIVLRSFVFTPFHIPSGSMKSGLLVGDYIFVSKSAYGYSRYSMPLAPRLWEDRIFFEEPARGDVIVFRLPSNPSIDYIKRLVGLPGDTISLTAKPCRVKISAGGKKKTNAGARTATANLKKPCPKAKATLCSTMRRMAR